MIERPDPDALMAGSLGQWLAGQQASRDEAKEKSRRYTFYGIVGAVSLGAFALILFRDIEATMGAGMVAFGIGSFFAHQARKKVTDAIKAEINTAIAGALGLNYSMAITSTHCFEQAKAFDLLPSFDDSSFEDEWSGALGEQTFRLHEGKLTEERGSGKSRRKVTVFEGTFLSIGFNRRFLGVTLVERQRNRRTFWFGSERDEITLNEQVLQRCEMVHPRFEDEFTVWSSDPVEGRYLVHPEYVERLVAVEQAYAGKNLRALFCGGELLIVLETGNMFESGSLEASDDRKLLERTIGQFEALASLATTLNERPR